MKVDEALRLLILLTQQANSIAAAVGKARKEGRDDLTDAELDTFVEKDDDARARLQAKIDALA